MLMTSQHPSSAHLPPTECEYHIGQRPQHTPLVVPLHPIHQAEPVIYGVQSFRYLEFRQPIYDLQQAVYVYHFLQSHWYCAGDYGRYGSHDPRALHRPWHA